MHVIFYTFYFHLRLHAAKLTELTDDDYETRHILWERVLYYAFIAFFEATKNFMLFSLQVLEKLSFFFIKWID